jgi:hypothetical protein
MDKEQIMTIILAEYESLLDQAVELKEAFGNEDAATQRAFSQWVVISNLIDRINEEIN